MITYTAIGKNCGYSSGYVAKILNGKATSKNSPVIEQAARNMGWYNDVKPSGKRKGFNKDLAMSLRNEGHSNAEICLVMDCSLPTLINQIGKEPKELVMMNRELGRKIKKQYIEGRAAIRSKYAAKVKIEFTKLVEEKLKEIYDLEKKYGVKYDTNAYMNNLRKH